MACRMRTFREVFGGQCPIRLDRRHLHELSNDISVLGVPSYVWKTFRLLLGWGVSTDLTGEWAYLSFLMGVDFLFERINVFVLRGTLACHCWRVFRYTKFLLSECVLPCLVFISSFSRTSTWIPFARRGHRNTTLQSQSVVWGLFLYTTESCGQEGDILGPGTKH